MERNYSVLEYLRRLENQNKPLYRFKAQSLEEWREWRSKLKNKLIELLGGFPEEKVPLNPEVTESFEKDGIIVEKVVYDTEENFSVPAYLLKPAGLKGKAPAILALHGHGRGKVDVVGISSSEVEYQKYIAPLNYDYGFKLAKKGYVVLAPDGRCFGELSKDGVTCTWGFTSSLLLGKTMVGQRVWDAIRSIDFLQSLPFVDKEKIGCVGLSWGGTWTAYTSALDERIKVAVISGYFSTFRDMLIERGECPCQYIPGILKYADFPDIVGLIAPRPLLIEYGKRDPLYTPSYVIKAYEKLKKIYDFLSAGNKLDIDIFDGGHMFSGRKSIAWLEKWLK